MTSRIADRPGDMLEEQVVECLKYLAILSCTRGRRIPVTPEVDDIWHELIVQTKSYDDLCRNLPGGRFVHHESITPIEYATRVGDAEFVSEFVQWIPDYVHSFGAFTEEAGRHWTIFTFLVDTMGMDITQINALGAESAPAVALPATSPWRALASIRRISDLYDGVEA